MAEKPPLTRVAGSLKMGDGGVTYLDQALWRKLAEAETDEEFCGSWLVLQGRMLGGVYSGMVSLGPPDQGPFTPMAIWPPGCQDFDNLAKVSELTLKERKGVVRGIDPEEEKISTETLHFHVAFPVRASGRLHGVVALEIDSRPQEELQSAMRQLQWGVAWLENWALRKEANQSSRIKQRITTVLDLAAVTLQEERLQASATAFVTMLANRLDCDRVSIGFLKGTQVKVRALSHSAQFGKELSLIRAIGAAMDECLDQKKVLVYPDPSEISNDILRAHAILATQNEDAAICTIPFLDKEGKGYGALTLERAVTCPQ